MKPLMPIHPGDAHEGMCIDYPHVYHFYILPFMFESVHQYSVIGMMGVQYTSRCEDKVIIETRY